MNVPLNYSGPNSLVGTWIEGLELSSGSNVSTALLATAFTVEVQDLQNGTPVGLKLKSPAYTVQWHLPYEKQKDLPALLMHYPSGTTYAVPRFGSITIQEEASTTIDVSAGFEGLAGALGAYTGGPGGALAASEAAASIAQGLSGTFDLTWEIDGSPEYTFSNTADEWTKVNADPQLHVNVSDPAWLSDPDGFANFDVTMKRIKRWTRKRWACDEYGLTGFIGPDRVLAKDLRPRTQFEPFYTLIPGRPLTPPTTGGGNN